MVDRVTLFLASWGYTGYSPIASGTVGTVAAIPFFWLFARIPDPWVAATGCAAAIAAACWIAGRAESSLGQHDSGIIVIDEVVGYLAATLFLPPTWTVTALTFFFFRAFDVLKPYPASYIDERLRGGTGVVLDDVVAGIYANLATRGLLLLTGHFLD